MNQDSNMPANATRQAAPVERGSIDSPRPDTTVTQDAGSSQDNFLPQDRMDDLRSRWNDVQAQFVDDPQSAVEKAHNLVAQLVDELTQTFTRERSTLEQQWQGGNVDTEALRVALQRYRAFFNRLLSS